MGKIRIHFFLTLCAESRGVNYFCKPIVGPAILESIRHYHTEQKWFCSVAVLMPDHVHLLLNIPSERTLSKTIAHWKRWIAKHHDIHWQANFFEIDCVVKKANTRGQNISFKIRCGRAW